MKFNKQKWIPLILFIIVLGLLSYWGFSTPTVFQTYSNQLIILTTLVYVYLTYEILRQTRQSRELPYINVLFLLSSKLDNNFLENYKELVISDRVKQLIEHFKQTSPSSKDMVFVLVENIGGANAIEVQLELKYGKKNFGEDSEQSKTMNFGTIKKGEKIMEFVDFFDNPSKEDSFKVKKCTTIFNTVSSKYSTDSPKKNDVTGSLSFKNDSEKVIINFLKQI